MPGLRRRHLLPCDARVASGSAATADIRGTSKISLPASKIFLYLPISCGFLTLAAAIFIVLANSARLSVVEAFTRGGRKRFISSSILAIMTYMWLENVEYLSYDRVTYLESTLSDCPKRLCVRLSPDFERSTANVALNARLICLWRTTYMSRPLTSRLHLHRSEDNSCIWQLN